MAVIQITTDPTSFSLGPDDAVAITSPTLVEALIKAPAQTLTYLNTFAPLKLDALSIDNEGRVIIADAAFATAIRNAAKAAMTSNDNNGICEKVDGLCRPN